MDHQEIKALIDLTAASGLSELDLDENGCRLGLSRGTMRQRSSRPRPRSRQRSIGHAPTRAEAPVRMRLAVREIEVEGASTNIPLHRQILQDEAFCAGEFDIHHLELLLRQRQAA